MDDLVSRQTAIEMLCDMRCGCKPKDCGLTLEQDGAEECADVRWIMSIPSARKTGHWIYGKEIGGIDLGLYETSKESSLLLKKVPLYEDVLCSNCMTRFRPYTFSYQYCPHCGARMENE